MQIRARVPLWAIESFGDRIKKSISYWISFQLKPRQDMTIHTARLGCNLFLGLFFSQLGKVTGNRNWFIHSFHCCVLHFNFSMTDFIIPPTPSISSASFPCVPISQGALSKGWSLQVKVLVLHPWSFTLHCFCLQSPETVPTKASLQGVVSKSWDDKSCLRIQRHEMCGPVPFTRREREPRTLAVCLL